MEKTKFIKLECPLFVILERKTKKDRKVHINLNTYRNLQYIVENQTKRKFKDIMKPQLEGIILDTPVEVIYKVFKGSRHKSDKMNFVSICSKYLMDAITEFGCWSDDNDDIIKTETILPSAIDKDNPRIEVVIKSI